MEPLHKTVPEESPRDVQGLEDNWQMEIGASGKSICPLVVDLDGALINTDLLVETAFEFVGRRPLAALRLLLWLQKGKPVLKRRLAEASQLDVATLPYNQAVLARIRAARESGQKVYLASASDERLVHSVAEHLGGFDGWFASDGVVNLSREAKAAKLVGEFGAQSFDYIGNDGADLPVWKAAHSAILVNTSPAVIRRLRARGIRCEQLSPSRRPIRNWIKLLRPHQWTKNTLVVVPILVAHVFTGAAFLDALFAFIAFSLCASSAYIVNDLIDIQADRQHPTKKERPFCIGSVPLLGGIVLAPVLVGLAFAVALQVSLMFTAVLVGYLTTTTAYSFVLKRKMLVDAVTLAALYTIRVVGGAAAIAVSVSQWLLAFSMFLFLALAFIKRYSEMTLRFDAGLPDPCNRDYKASDLPVIASLAAAAGYSAVIVFSLYLSSDTVRALYRHTNVLWCACPLLLYWISRMLLLSHRGLIDDDPVIFALRDRVSLLTVMLIVLIGALAL